MYASHIPSRILRINQQEFLFFSGTAYLAMHARREFGELVWEGIQRYGTNYGASRLGNISIPVFEEAEEKITHWLGAPATVMVSSGTFAGRLILEVLSEYKPHYAPNAHIAINPEYKKHQPHLLVTWIEETIDQINKSKEDKHLIAFNSIDSLTALRPSLSWIHRLPKDKDILLLIDDSHGIGVCGDQGRGLYPELIQLHANSLMIASMGKAMGLPAGIIVGSSQYISRVKAHPLFGGSSPMVPAYAHAFIYGSSIYEKAYRDLNQNILFFKNEMQQKHFFRFADQFPVFCTDRHELAAFLESNLIRISHFAYPSPTDNLYTRVVLNAMHTREDLEQLIFKINAFDK